MSGGYLAKCGQKKRHPTQIGAEVQRTHMISSGQWRAETSNTYFCEQCGHWHAGRMGARNRGKGRKTTKNTPLFLASQ